MNRHERRKASAQARRQSISSMECVPLIDAMLADDPAAWQALKTIVDNLDTGKHSCAACDMEWHRGRFPGMLVRLREGRQPDGTLVGCICTGCVDTLGVEGAGKAAAKLLGMSVKHISFGSASEGRLQ